MYEFDQYIIASKLFIRMLGAIYFFAFSAFIPQIRGLVGKEGILPVERFLQLVELKYGKKSYYLLPSIFWLYASDAFLVSVVFAGTLVSIFLMLGIWPPLMIFLLYVLYISIVSIGQDFLSFGWEVFLLEITANAFFLSWTDVPNPFVWISLNVLIFRFHFQAGAVKLQSGDASWKNLTAMAYHYQTQPIPNTQAFFFHKLPLWFHKFSCLLMFFSEFFIPLLIFGTQEMRLCAFVFLAGFQGMVWFSGNFSYLNHLTVVLCLMLISDQYLHLIFGISSPPPIETSLTLDIFLSIIGCFLLTVQLIRFYHHFFWNSLFDKILSFVSPFHIGNRYGIFAVMTTKRYEVVIEGSEDGQSWKEYAFWYKPSELDRRPRRISPFQPRLDWQVWFLPFSYYYGEPWFSNFLFRILQGSPHVLKLVRVNPFSKNPPKYIRALLYDYTFTDFNTWKKTGRWWDRVYVGQYSPTRSLPE